MEQPAACVAGQVTVVELKAETSEVPTDRLVFAVFMNDRYDDRLETFCAAALMPKPKIAKVTRASKRAFPLRFMTTPLGMKLKASFHFRLHVGM